MRDKDTTNMTTDTTTTTTTNPAITHYDSENGRHIQNCVARADCHPTMVWEDTCLALSDTGLRCSLHKNHLELMYFHRSVKDGIVQDCWEGEVPEPVQDTNPYAEAVATPAIPVFPENPSFPMVWTVAANDSMEGLGESVLMEAIRYRDNMIIAGREVMDDKDRSIRDLSDRVSELQTINGNQVLNIEDYQAEIRGRQATYNDLVVRFDARTGELNDALDRNKTQAERIQLLLNQVAELETLVGDDAAQKAAERTNAHELERRAADAKIQELEERNRNLSESLNRMSVDWDNDIERISDRLIQESERRNWCGEYDSVVDDLNSELKRGLRERTREYVIRQTYTVVVEMTVTARNEDDASEMASDQEPDFSVDGDWSVEEWDLRNSSVDEA